MSETRQTSIRVISLVELTTITVNAQNRLSEAVTDALNAASDAIGGQAEVIKVERLQGTEVVEVKGWETSGQNSVGIDPLVVTIGAGSITSMFQCMMGKMDSLTLKVDALISNEATTAFPMLNMIASQILLSAIGQQGLQRTTCDYFAKLGPAHQPFVELCSNTVGLDVTKFIHLSDRLIERRNNKIAHVTTLEVLDEQVARAVNLINNPDVIKAHPHECWVIKNYEV